MVEGIDDELLIRVAHIRAALIQAIRGDQGARLVCDLPDDHPLSSLYAGVNDMIAAFQGGRAYQQELETKVATIELQREAIRELSTPIMEVWRGVLCLPVVGVLDSTRSAEMTELLLKRIVEKKARCAIVDITGIEVMDTATADHFIRMAKSVRLLGAECALTGINPNIAQTLVHMGIDLDGIATHRNLRSALQHYVGRLDVETEQ